jgi:uncharacterized repeat protein (TIGR03803 family)
MLVPINHRSFRLAAFISTFTLALLTAASTAAQDVHTLHSFLANGRDGSGPLAGLTFDASGNLYGTTAGGGVNNYGTVFQLSPKAGGGWSEKILHSFNDNGIDGYHPGSGLVLDSKGNLYGVTYLGGSGGCAVAGVVLGCGIAFELKPQSNGGYKEQVIYTFKDYGDGTFPVSTLIFDSVGNLYGTAQTGGANGRGTVFELSPSTGATWTETILWSFDGTDGQDPRGGLIFDSAGNLYGTTQDGGAHKYGTVFELSPSAGGTWTETVLHNFTLSSTDVAYPDATLIFDSVGNIYSTASYGGQSGGGGVFELTPSTGGAWTETVLHFFNDNGGSDGYNPQAPLIFDASGNLYSTTVTGGTGQCEQIGLVIGCGTIFKLTPASGGTWTETIEYNFNFTTDNDPEGPESAGLISDSAGNFYGTTFGGGPDSDGTVFEFTP